MRSATLLPVFAAVVLGQYAADTTTATYPVAPATTSAPVICNAAALQRGDCTLPPGFGTSSTSSFVICNAAALQRGDCTLPPGFGSGTSSSSFVFCNAAANLRGDCTLTGAIEPALSTKTGDAYTTVHATAYTTVCPEATTFTWGPSTYTASASQTIVLPSYALGTVVNFTSPAVPSVPAATATYVATGGASAMAPGAAGLLAVAALAFL